MKTLIRTLLLFALLAPLSSIAEGSSTSDNSEIAGEYKYTRWNYLDTLLDIPQTTLTIAKEAFGPGTFWPWMGIISSSALLYVYDEEILDEVQRFGRKIGLGNEDNTRTILSLGEIPLFRGPTDAGSTLYYLGDGWTHMTIAMGFALYGEVAERPRAFNTGLQIFHGMLVSTIFNQAVKRASGRESPLVRTERRGKWRPFPSVADYQEKTSKLDAFPSGHVMTATITFTVISENYPEYDYWVKPVQYVWLSLLMLQMINNGVHWASDYPLGIAMGYLTGKIVARNGRSSLHKKDQSQIIYMPMLDGDIIGAQALYRF